MLTDPHSLLLITIFVIAIGLISLEHSVGINKSWIALLAGSSMWIINALGAPGAEIKDAIKHESADIFELIIFLMGAMTVVEMMGHFRFFSWLEYHLMRRKISGTTLFWMIGAVTFFGSAILDNLTITLIMLQIGRRIYLKPENFMVYAANTIIAANAGGAMSPVGDITTIMLWLAEKFTAWQILAYGTLPALVCWAIPQAFLARRMVPESLTDRKSEPQQPLKWEIIGVGLVTFFFAVVVNAMHLPPFFGILLGLGVAAVIIDLGLKTGRLKKREGHITNLIQRIDISTIKFFVGVLLAVGALNHAGILQKITALTYGDHPGQFSIIAGHIAVGAVSSVMDNIPLTAAVIKMLPDNMSMFYWILLALTAGTGGSMLVIGSAAGVAAMGQVKELTFVNYLKLATLPAALGYVGAVGTWYLMFRIFH